MKKVLIFGATSAIAMACARLLAKQGASITLIGRNASALEDLAKALLAHGAVDVRTEIWDMQITQGLDPFVEKLWREQNGFDCVLSCHGVLANDPLDDLGSEEILRIVNVNYTSNVVILTQIQKLVDTKKECAIGIITSVAGDWGRQSNFLYGSTKSALSTYIDGLTHKYAGSPVRILNFKSGYTDTPMTASYKKGFLWIKPEQAAKQIVKAMDSNTRGVLYVPSFWRAIMFVVRCVPDFIFWRTKL